MILNNLLHFYLTLLKSRVYYNNHTTTYLAYTHWAAIHIWLDVLKKLLHKNFKIINVCVCVFVCDICIANVIFYWEEWSLEGNKLIEDNEPFINEAKKQQKEVIDTKVHSTLKIDMILLNMSV